MSAPGLEAAPDCTGLDVDHLDAPVLVRDLDHIANYLRRYDTAAYRASHSPRLHVDDLGGTTLHLHCIATHGHALVMNPVRKDHAVDDDTGHYGML